MIITTRLSSEILSVKENRDGIHIVCSVGVQEFVYYIWSQLADQGCQIFII